MDTTNELRKMLAHLLAQIDSKPLGEVSLGAVCVHGAEKIIRMHDLVMLVGLSRATIYRMIGDGDFPAPIKLGRHASGWLESAVQSWIRRKAG